MFISKRRFTQLIRAIAQEKAKENELRWQKEGLEALQYGAEVFLSNLFYMGQMAAIHARRQTLMVQDMRFVYSISEAGAGSETALQNMRVDLTLRSEESLSQQKPLPKKSPKGKK